MRRMLIGNWGRIFGLPACGAVFLFPLVLAAQGAAEPSKKADPTGGNGMTAPNEEVEGKQATAIVRRMLAAVRLEKFDHALKYVGVEDMARFLMDRHYAELTEPQRGRLAELLGQYIKKRGFPMANRYIGRVGLSYDRPAFVKGRVHIKSSIVYSGAERLVFTWILQKSGKEYRVVDFLDATGNSSLTKSRDTQILPVYRKRGAAGVLDSLDRVVKSLK